MCLWHHRENSTVNIFNVTIVSVPAKHQKKSWLSESCTKYHTVKTDFHHESQIVAAIICFKHKRKELKIFKDKWAENTYWGVHVQWTVTIYQSNHMTTGHDYFFLYPGSSLQASCWTQQDWIGDATEKGAFRQTLNMVLAALDNPCLHVFWLCWWWLIYLLLLSAWTEHCLQSSGYPFEAQLVIVTTKWNSFHTSCNLWYKHTRMRIIQKNERKTSVQFRVS